MWTRWTFLFEFNVKAGRRNCSGMTTVAVAAMMVTLACALKIVAADKVIAYDLVGDYCAKIGCCSERQEDCYALISNTRCYCDDFCYHNHTVSNDCCPDFMSVCKGVTTPDPPNTSTSVDECIYDDLAGDYCAKVGCCIERNDDVCSAPILGTRCYCDDVCYLNRTGSEDCCPDFMSVCKGVVPDSKNGTSVDECIYDDLAGDYCAKVGCCIERNDDVCSAPILGTRCYCDDVCYRGIHQDGAPRSVSWLPLFDTVYLLAPAWLTWWCTTRRMTWFTIVLYPAYNGVHDCLAPSGQRSDTAR